MNTPLPATIEETDAALVQGAYLAGRDLATVVFLALKLGRPLFLEGEPGTGKTEIAKVLSHTLGRRLIRLQCYEGLDTHAAVYEWDHAGQIMAIRLAEAGARDRAALEGELFSERYLLKRPLLRALEPHPGGAPVLLIDELDRADEPFEAFLLEVLGDFQITVPEFGTIKAAEPPIVIITSNRTRDVHDAIRRRCLYHWVDFPTLDREIAILSIKVPGAGDILSRQIASFVQSLRGEDLFKRPGIAETLDWAEALLALNANRLEPHMVNATLGVLLKYQDDLAAIRGDRAEGLLIKSGAATS